MKGLTKEEKDMSEGLCRNPTHLDQISSVSQSHVMIWTNIPVVSLIFLNIHSYLKERKSILLSS